MTAIHGDVAVCHNALFDGDALTGLLDPGATEAGPRCSTSPGPWPSICHAAQNPAHSSTATVTMPWTKTP